MASQGPLFGSSSGPRPTPKIMAARLPVPGSLPRRQFQPPSLAEARDPNAVYLLDSTVALAFAHIKQMSLLTQHYGQQLRVLDDVYVEWRRLANESPRALPPRATAKQEQDHRQKAAVRLAARTLMSVSQTLLAPLVVELDERDEDAVEALRRELSELPVRQQFQPRSGNDRGECTSVLYGEQLRRQGRQVVVLCTDDKKGGNLAHNHGLGCREVAGVLREMAVEDRITPATAHAHYQAAMVVSRPKQQDQHLPLAYFS